MTSTKILALALIGAAAEAEKPKGIMDMAGFAQNPVKEMPVFPAVEQKFDEQKSKHQNSLRKSNIWTKFSQNLDIFALGQALHQPCLRARPVQLYEHPR